MRTNLHNEAHLSPSRRSMALIRYLPTGKRRSTRGWALFVGFVVLNEMRGTYVAAQFLAQFLKAYHGG